MAESKPASMFSLIQRISGAGDGAGSDDEDGQRNNDDDDDDGDDDDDNDDDDEDDDNEEDKLAFIEQNPPLAAILDKWWQSCLTLLDGDRNGTIERGEYVNLYKRLIFGTSRMYGKKAKLSDDIDALIETGNATAAA
ncbi:hypothetical protein SPRG_18421 [Saprolegnia parasitica CBS 223.65]|uniref:EF-hand domain-containing protein n=1 Tax=Saprolegnia parasitica (strain CBS 223.65) TaxID=695850 RepID=A0A067BH19_SAPPC|nr:hypothetical protein SPRG_18421 [Saprolegnia parasitica CBS 223.65]KDO16045.1 hypothetical protein SPRG_18421 [Saprolegnia parasitica CBS 223.65]|eukprot:XP_012213248.1 hypothetical protein SPRG_18421 [Saprolegnia parasitica CBS 223.65]